jgi:hypothetical protein
MAMKESRVFYDLAEVPPRQLARMLNVADLRGWAEVDAGAILRHQLDAPILAELAQVPGIEMDRLRARLSNADWSASLLEQLTGSSPSLEMLEGIKSFARHAGKSADSPLWGSPAAVIYYATIAAAIVHHRSSITQLADAEREEGFRWAKAQAGAEQLAHLFDEALRGLK